MTLRAGGTDTEFGGGLACVPVDATECSTVANAIASAMIGPRPPDVDGAIEIADHYVSLSTLPAPLLGPSAAATVDRPLLDDLWREVCAQQRARVESAHASRRLLRHRSLAAFERAHTRLDEIASLTAPAPIETPPVTATWAAPPPLDLSPLDLSPVEVPAVDEVSAVDEVTERLESLLDAFDALTPVASPLALALADAFDELAARPAPVVEEPAEEVDFGALEARLAAARFTAARVGGGVRPAARTRIEACHRVVVAAESALFESRRRDRPELLARYQQALGAERAALTEAGVDSYASFLVTIAAGAPPVDLEVRLRAELELADAEAELDRARAALENDPNAAPEDEFIELRVRAAQLLGHFPGDDPASELGALRVEHPDASRRRDELREALWLMGTEPGTGVVATARDALRARHEAPAAAPIPGESPVEIPAVEVPAVASSQLDAETMEEQRALEEESVAHTRDREEHERALAALERDLLYLHRVQALDVGSIEIDELGLLLDSLFDGYRAGDLLGGRLPLVLDAALDGLGGLRASAVADRLRVLDDIQVIVVTGDPELARLLDRAGAFRVRWSDARSFDEVDERDAPTTVARDGEVPDPPATSSCTQHADKAAAAECAQCGKPSCIDCLVYVPGDSELACVTCAEAMHSRSSRLLRRRGA